MSSLKDALENFGRTTGDYWSQNNAEFEASNPSITDRAIRAVNPMTSLGSALGAMRDAADNGLKPSETALALLQSLPFFAATRLGSVPGFGVIKASQQMLPDTLKTLAKLGMGTSASVAAEEVQNPSHSNNHPK